MGTASKSTFSPSPKQVGETLPEYLKGQFPETIFTTGTLYVDPKKFSEKTQKHYQVVRFRTRIDGQDLDIERFFSEERISQVEEYTGWHESVCFLGIDGLEVERDEKGKITGVKINRTWTNNRGQPIHVAKCTHLLLPPFFREPKAFMEPKTTGRKPVPVQQERTVPLILDTTLLKEAPEASWDRNPEELDLTPQPLPPSLLVQAPTKGNDDIDPDFFWEMFQEDLPGPFEREAFLAYCKLSLDKYPKETWTQADYIQASSDHAFWIKPVDPHTAYCQKNWSRQSRLFSQEVRLTELNKLYGKAALVTLRDSQQLTDLLAKQENPLLPGVTQTKDWNAGQVDCYLAVIEEAITSGTIQPIEKKSA